MICSAELAGDAIETPWLAAMATSSPISGMPAAVALSRSANI
jgi:hypothetical protein